GGQVQTLPDDGHRQQFRQEGKAHTVSASSGSIEYIELDEGGKSYFVYDGSIGDTDGAGLAILQGENVLEQHRCGGPAQSPLSPSLFRPGALPGGGGPVDFAFEPRTSWGGGRRGAPPATRDRVGSNARATAPRRRSIGEGRRASRWQVTARATTPRRASGWS